ncbi:hypothetical protein A2960_02045 [Candidatus Gottesmanbacteria bacterium RIFCSPLOWO2_01_FULL_39_12b]|uniref:ATP-grasp domain-containing protein n=1 Tax=Candidatus Gottesmanbacteria bacterium RIFCSPLOWO2_01_FULL_39_12b TaxID=1798388 RepID=A0A1F6ARJ6_9BACT|nr:MAG: hypothetical protein A2960_02045 [Candidatus Gottesmanbacteria bacterium RIFCSPLOWO2_01_FULL_39_12b]
MNLAFCFNLKHNQPSKNISAQIEADYDSIETIVGIKKAIESGGHNVINIEADREVYFNFVKNKKNIKIVFNISEGLGGEAREAHIPAMLEHLQIPYTHSGPLTQAITLDKTYTKMLLYNKGIGTPKFQVIKKISDQIDSHLKYPLIVKPNSEGSSIGIFNENLVFDRIKLVERVEWLLTKFKEPVLIEEYIDGREFTVSVLGNNPPKVLPIVEQNFSIFPENMAHFASFEAKWMFEDELPDPHEAYFCPARIPESLKSKIENISLIVFDTLNCKDVCRIDYRVDKNDNVYFIEVNSLPGMDYDSQHISYLPIAARTAGFSFEGLVNTILNEAIKRYNFYTKDQFSHYVKNFWPTKYLEIS